MTDTTEPATALSMERIGEIMVALPLVAYKHGHTQIETTMGIYAHAHPDDFEVRFVRDLFTKPLDEFLEYWMPNDGTRGELFRRISAAKVAMWEDAQLELAKDS